MANDAVNICTLFLFSALYRKIVPGTPQYDELLPLRPHTEIRVTAATINVITIYCRLRLLRCTQFAHNQYFCASSQTNEDSVARVFKYRRPVSFI